ncbi:hypothetical protein KEM56_005493 [Ascosphaera pollenicola]|nr:hypothetical protein KEM56_005493 [Ascosphaera pollenicola]
MPKLVDVARAVSFIEKHLVGKTIAKVTAHEDPMIFGKAGTSHTEVIKAFTGKKITSVGRQGKYLYLLMSGPPHAVMHCGMTGWMMIKGVDTLPYEAHFDWKLWPPKYEKMRFIFDDDETESAFCDPRRLGRVFVVNCAADEIKNNAPLQPGGPDPVLDKGVVTEQWLLEKFEGRNVPAKAMLMDQGFISGLGNWMSDEVLYHAGISPTTRVNGLSSSQISDLKCAIQYVCSTAVDLNGIVEDLPSDWLVHHRRKKQGLTMPNGDQVVFTKVGGRTTVYVPAVQEKEKEESGDKKRKRSSRVSSPQKKR